nr:unnamed protein product [Callosobruchus chinensis]
MFLPDSDEELTGGTDVSELGESCNQQKFKKKNTKKTKTDQDVLSQPCCSKSLSVETGKTPHIFPEDSNEIPQENETAPEHNPEPQNKEEDHEDRHPENTWKSPTGSHQVFEYSSESGLHASYAALLINDLSPYNCFRAFIDDKIIEAMEDQTNLYASQVLCDAEDISRESRLHQWTPTSKGRTIVADNYYTSLELANILLDKQTHYIGTLRSNRRGNPREVIEKKLKKGEVFGLENERGICILKWKDKRDVLLWSTKHSTETVEIQRRTGAIQKPQAVVDYNEAKSSIDQSDQMTSYNAPLRKSLK